MTRGPAKGHGGRPRKKPGTNLPRKGDGYKRRTVGPKSKGTQVYEHRAKKGMPKGSKGKGAVVHHKDHNPQNNSPENLQVVSKKRNRTA